MPGEGIEGFLSCTSAHDNTKRINDLTEQTHCQKAQILVHDQTRICFAEQLADVVSESTLHGHDCFLRTTQGSFKGLELESGARIQVLEDVLDFDFVVEIP